MAHARRGAAAIVALACRAGGAGDRHPARSTPRWCASPSGPSACRCRSTARRRRSRSRWRRSASTPPSSTFRATSPPTPEPRSSAADGLPSEWGDPYTDFVGHVMGSEPGSNPHWATYAGWGAYAPTSRRSPSRSACRWRRQLTGWNPAGALRRRRGRSSGPRLDDGELHLADRADAGPPGTAGRCPGPRPATSSCSWA